MAPGTGVIKLKNVIILKYIKRNSLGHSCSTTTSLASWLSCAVRIAEDEEEEYDEDVHEFICPFCQKYPPKSIDFGEHLANCSEDEDSD